MPVFDNAVARRLFTALIIADIFFISFHTVLGVLPHTGSIRSVEVLYGHFNLYNDFGYPEVFGFGKWTIACVFSLVSFMMTRNRAYVGVAVASAAFLADDSGQIHESIGAELDRNGYNGMFGLDGASIGEILGFGILGLIVFSALLYSWRNAVPHFRGPIKVIALAVFGMFFCGIVFDLAHNLIAGNLQIAFLAELVGIIEDGGEMLFLSLYCAAVFSEFFRVATAQKETV